MFFVNMQSTHALHFNGKLLYFRNVTHFVLILLHISRHRTNLLPITTVNFMTMLSIDLIKLTTASNRYYFFNFNKQIFARSLSVIKYRYFYHRSTIIVETKHRLLKYIESVDVYTLN